MSHPLVERVQEICSEPFLIDPNDRKAEIETNTRWVSATDEEVSSVDAGELVEAIRALAVSRRKLRLAAGSSGPVTFYVWFDEQACQLRISTESAAPSGLSFGCQYRTDVQLEDVVGAFLSSRFHEGMPIPPSDSENDDYGQPTSLLSVYVEALE